MQTFRVTSSEPVILRVVLAIGVGVLFVVAGIAQLVRPGPESAVLIILALVSLALTVVTLRHVHEIVVMDDGTVVFVRNLGTTRIAARDIDSLEGRLVTTYEGLTWVLRVRPAREASVDFEAFAGAREFVAAVRARNPAVAVTGHWPMGPP